MFENNRKFLALVGVVAIICGFAGAILAQYSGLTHPMIRSYLVQHPEILAEMAKAYDQAQMREKLAASDGGVTQAFPGAFLGNPNGDIVLVEFSDYSCTYCRASRAHVEALVAANPDLKVVIREWPIFEGSEEPARMALAAAKQGKFAEFHRAMFAHGVSGAGSAREVAAAIGMDLGAADAIMGSKEIDLELGKTMQMARALGFSGTPSWVIGGQVLQGAQGEKALQDAINTARQNRAS